MDILCDQHLHSRFRWLNQSQKRNSCEAILERRCERVLPIRWVEKIDLEIQRLHKLPDLPQKGCDLWRKNIEDSGWNRRRDRKIDLKMERRRKGDRWGRNWKLHQSNNLKDHRNCEVRKNQWEPTSLDTQSGWYQQGRLQRVLQECFQRDQRSAILVSLLSRRRRRLHWTYLHPRKVFLWSIRKVLRKEVRSETLRPKSLSERWIRRPAPQIPELP